MTTTKIIGRIQSVERVNNSINGNPRFNIAISIKTELSGQVAFAVRTFKTQADGAISYHVENARLADKQERLIELTINGRNVVTDFELVAD